jgi:hypothetical protein
MIYVDNSKAEEYALLAFFCQWICANKRRYTRHLQVACALAFLVHPSHVLMYAPGDSLRRRLPATRII